MNASPGDIIRGLEIIHWICQNGFVSENSAANRLEGFRHDIEEFGTSLRELDTALKNAHARYLARRSSDQQARALNPRGPGFERERIRIIGNFELTLRQCQRILVHEINPSWYGAQVARSLYWAAGTAPKVEELKRQLKFHMAKISLVVARLTLEVMTDMDDRFDTLVHLVELLDMRHDRLSRILQCVQELLWALVHGGAVTQAHAPQRLDDISEELQSAFRRALQSARAPAAFADNGHNVDYLPLEELFNAMVYHFEQSRDAATRPERQEEYLEYLELLKARWLFQLLEASNAFREARPGYYFKIATREMEFALLARFQSGQLVRYDQARLASLDPRYQEIWHVQEVQLDVIPTDPRLSERIHLRLELPASSGFTAQRLYVFARSSHQYRLVREEELVESGRAIEKHTNSFTINLHQDRLVPSYAFPSCPRPLQLTIFSDHYEYAEDLLFPDDETLHGFQCSLLGYEFKIQRENVRFATDLDDVQGAGRVQIWQEPVTEDQGTLSPGSSNSLSSTSRNFGPASRSFTVGSTQSAGITSVTHSEEGFQANRVPLPVIVIFCEIRGRLSFLFVKLDEGIYSKHPAEPTNLVLSHRRKKPFPVHLGFAGTLPGPSHERPTVDFNSWDLSILRQPEHPRFKTLEKKKLSHIHLKFSNEEDKQIFNVELEERFTLRNEIIRLRNEHLNQFIADAEPGGTRNDYSRSSLSPTARTAHGRRASDLSSPRSSTVSDATAQRSSSNTTDIERSAPPNGQLRTSLPTRTDQTDESRTRLPEVPAMPPRAPSQMDPSRNSDAPQPMSLPAQPAGRVRTGSSAVRNGGQQPPPQDAIITASRFDTAAGSRVQARRHPSTLGGMFKAAWVGPRR